MIKKSFIPTAKRLACVALASISLSACQAHKAMVTPNEFAWNELVTPHPEKAKEFYQGMFGWTTTSEEMNGMTYNMFMHHGKPVAGMMKAPDGKNCTKCKKKKHHHKHMRAHWMSYVAVENIEASLEKAVKLGAKVMMPKTAAGDKGHFAILKDPTGAHISLWQAM